MRIHFIGIGGIGVSALAQYYLAKGHQVKGSDLVSSEITDLLKKKGAEVFIGQHKARNVSQKTDLVIYSPAVQQDNPELKKAYKLQTTNYKLQILSYPQALGELTKKYFTIAISGTHGKSTTTAMIALILIKAGLDPTVILGTKLKEFGNSNFRMGDELRSSSRFANARVGKTINYKLKTKNYLVIEADEWSASFLNYWPKIIVLTNIEREHLDYYKSLNHILRTYKEYISHLPRKGFLVINKDDKNIQKAIFNFQFSIFNKFSIFNFQFSKSKDVRKLKQVLKIPGEHNVLNALAALTTARGLKIPDRISFKSLSEYKGAWRRFEESSCSIKTNELKTINYKLISDYAHHPTEIKVTLKAAREKFPHKKIWCIFQPHQYQRTFYLFKDFVKVLRQAQDKLFVDKLIITDIYDVAGREQKNIKKKVNSKKLIKEINRPSATESRHGGTKSKKRTKSSSPVYLPKKGIINYLKKNLKGREVVIIMGAGDIYKITEDLLYRERG